MLHPYRDNNCVGEVAGGYQGERQQRFGGSREKMGETWSAAIVQTVFDGMMRPV